jgi:hypothetical protein
VENDIHEKVRRPTLVPAWKRPSTRTSVPRRLCGKLFDPDHIHRRDVGRERLRAGTEVRGHKVLRRAHAGVVRQRGAKGINATRGAAAHTTA